MGVLEGIETSNIQEPHCWKEDGEVKVRITSVKKGQDKNGLAYLMPFMEVVIEGDELVKDFSYYLPLPTSDNKPLVEGKRFEQMKFDFANFCKAFQIPLDRLGDPEDDWAGNEAWAILGCKESDAYGEQNFIKKFVVGR